MLLDRIDKEPTDIARTIIPMTWWLDEGEVISQVVSAQVLPGMAGWSEAPYPPPGSPQPYDPTPLLLSTVALDASNQQLIVFTQFGTAGVAYTCQFVLLGTSDRQITIELGVQITGVPPEEPLPLPAPPTGAGQQPADWYLNIKGGTMQGALYLYDDPKYPTEAVTKRYVDSLTFANGPFMPEAGGTFTGAVVMTDTLTLRPDDPTGPLEATPKQYVDGRVASMSTAYLPLVGGQLTGALLLHASPANALEAATKQYVDGLVAGPFLPLSGGQLTGSLLLHAAPTGPTEATTKQYVDGRIRNQLRRELQWTAGAVLSNGTAYFSYSAPYAGTIQSLTYLTGAGSFVATVQINGVNVSGLNALLVNSVTATIANATANNTFAVGNTISVVLASASGLPTGTVLSLAMLLN
jgi:hypothetical protein